MSVPLIIPCDLPCIGCGYNLRTLALESRCPECGQPVMKTLAAIPGGMNPELEDLLTAHGRKQYEFIAAKAGCTVDAIMIVSAACRHAEGAQATGDQGRQHVSARDVCDAFREHVLFYFNDTDEAVDLLTEWGIRTSEDVGRIIFTMVDAGWMAAQPEDSVSDFSGLFTLDTLFDRAG